MALHLVVESKKENMRELNLKMEAGWRQDSEYLQRASEMDITEVGR